MKKLHDYFSRGEITLWISSVLLIILSFIFLTPDKQPLNLIASLIGTTALLFNAKGNPIGQVLMIGFSTIYAIISFSCAYYGEMITYLGMSLPMAVLALFSWVKHPYKGNKSEVLINQSSKKECLVIYCLAVVVTVLFYFILRWLNTANLIWSTLSVATSFLAAAFSFRRSPFYALGYVLNDLILIVLWTITTIQNISYLSVVICFIVFLVNDFYGFISWQKRLKKQQHSLTSKSGS